MNRSQRHDEFGHGAGMSIENVKLVCMKIARLWFSGFTNACCLHRVYFFCRRSRKIFVKTGQCFVLNGGIFLGSIFFFQWIVLPFLQWLLVSPLKEDQIEISGEFFSTTLQNMLIGICYIFWLYPLYIISFVINCIWYNEIAQYAFSITEEHSHSSGRQRSLEKLHTGSQNSRSHKNNGMASILLNIGEQIYSVVMLSIFFIEVFAVSFIPYIGKLLNFLLLSWLYAYYCFDYRWGFAKWSLERRLLFFETNWAFFAGFGSPCVLATFFFSQFVSYGIMAILFPMFVLIATGSHPEVVGNNAEKEGGSSYVILPRIPIFYLANMFMVVILRLSKGIGTYLLSRRSQR